MFLVRESVFAPRATATAEANGKRKRKMREKECSGDCQEMINKRDDRRVHASPLGRFVDNNLMHSLAGS